MGDDDPGREDRVLPGRWAIQADAQASNVSRRLEVALASLDTPTPRQLKAAAGVRRHLDEVHATTRRPSGGARTGRRASRPHDVDRWRGTSVERAYLHLHAAQSMLVELLSPAEVDARVVDAVARVRAALDVDDVRRQQAEELLSMATSDPRKPALLAHVLEVGYEASDELHSRIRNFRNILLFTAALTTVLVAGLLGLVSAHPTSLALCFAPSTTAAADQLEGVASDGTVCPTGEPVPTAGDVLLVAGLGLLGGVLAAAFSIRRLRGCPTPYQVPIALALLKVPTGALTAVAGLVLIGGDFVPGLSQLDSQRQILAYALVLGYAQQLATRLVDDRAEQLVSSLPDKQSGRQPAASTLPGAVTDRPPVPSQPGILVPTGAAGT